MRLARGTIGAMQANAVPVPVKPRKKIVSRRLPVALACVSLRESTKFDRIGGRGARYLHPLPDCECIGRRGEEDQSGCNREALASPLLSFGNSGG
jgi:hypothetical protein